jgi:DNA-directed RNA polymerase alpha subunit
MIVFLSLSNWLECLGEVAVMSGLCDQITTEREVRRKRDQEIVAARETGQSYAAIGRAFQMSGDNVKDRIERFHQNKRMHESIDPFAKLTPRTLRLLHGEELTTVEKVVEVYRRNELFSIRNFGTKSLREIETWFPVKPAKSQ